jgi:hypothetical protein
VGGHHRGRGARCPRRPFGRGRPGPSETCRSVSRRASLVRTSCRDVSGACSCAPDRRRSRVGINGSERIASADRLRRLLGAGVGVESDFAAHAVSPKTQKARRSARRRDPTTASRLAKTMVRARSGHARRSSNPGGWGQTRPSSPPADRSSIQRHSSRPSRTFARTSIRSDLASPVRQTARTVDSPWAAQVTTHTIPRINAHLRPIQGLP